MNKKRKEQRPEGKHLEWKVPYKVPNRAKPLTSTAGLKKATEEVLKSSTQNINEKEQHNK